MNGQMYQICRIAAAARTALREQTALIFTPVQYENKIEFRFLPQKE